MYTLISLICAAAGHTAGQRSFVIACPRGGDTISKDHMPIIALPPGGPAADP